MKQGEVEGSTAILEGTLDIFRRMLKTIEPPTIPPGPKNYDIADLKKG